MHVIATAGHVDHGKSTLVKALTGTDPDRLEEEHRRGLSIQLGYCWTTLEPVGEVAFVDVPGHERFLSTMLSGIGPVPAVLFVVAADDPWMPQAAEHLAALDALSVSSGVVAVTRSDLADPGPARKRAEAELSRTSLRGAPVVAVSGRTGEGLDELRAQLVALVTSLPVADESADVRLWVDRRFSIKGVGTVVTGTLPAGRICVGDSLGVRVAAGAGPRCAVPRAAGRLRVGRGAGGAELDRRGPVAARPRQRAGDALCLALHRRGGRPGQSRCPLRSQPVVDATRGSAAAYRCHLGGDFLSAAV
ncbi:MAG: GTP-binding protein [Nocardioidaceae bacterium]